MAGDVLEADPRKWPRAGRVAPVRPERAVRPCGGVEVPVYVAVVDRHREAALQRRGDPVHPGAYGEIDLAAVAVRESVGQATETPGQAGSRGLPRLLDEIAVSLRHVQLQDAVIDQEAVYGEGVDELVRYEASCDAVHGHAAGLDAVEGRRRSRVGRVSGSSGRKRPVHCDVPHGRGEAGFEASGVGGDVLPPGGRRPRPSPRRGIGMACREHPTCIEAVRPAVRRMRGGRMGWCSSRPTALWPRPGGSIRRWGDRGPAP